MSAPNTEDPLDTAVNDHYVSAPADAERVAREWTREFAAGGEKK